MAGPSALSTRAPSRSRNCSRDLSPGDKEKDRLTVSVSPCLPGDPSVRPFPRCPSACQPGAVCQQEAPACRLVGSAQVLCRRSFAPVNLGQSASLPPPLGRGHPPRGSKARCFLSPLPLRCSDLLSRDHASIRRYIR